MDVPAWFKPGTVVSGTNSQLPSGLAVLHKPPSWATESVPEGSLLADFGLGVRYIVRPEDCEPVEVVRSSWFKPGARVIFKGWLDYTGRIIDCGLEGVLVEAEWPEQSYLALVLDAGMTTYTVGPEHVFPIPGGWRVGASADYKEAPAEESHKINFREFL